MTIKMRTLNTSYNYDSFLDTPTAGHWKRLGLKRRGGVATPLFSIHSESSVGIGELPDLPLLGAWCRSSGMSLIQLLPLNDVGFDFRPYDAQTSFALDPMYLSLEKLKGVAKAKFAKDISTLRKQFPAGGRAVNYRIKGAKLELLWKMYGSAAAKLPPAFQKFCRDQAYWLEDYALYKVIKELQAHTGWEAWDEPFRSRHEGRLQEVRAQQSEQLQFQRWLQWQLFLQAADARKALSEQGVSVMGDIPFLVSRDSADVWAHQSYFKLDQVSGAPPDLYFSNGQRWGMPPYNWTNIEADGHEYLIHKLRYAENFYDLFRIDHVVGAFRIWTIPVGQDPATAGLYGAFDPADEGVWEDHGRKLLRIMFENTKMMPCAEDLGTIPDCCFKVLEEFAIPGMDVQRWRKDWGHSYDFLEPEKYRRHSITVLSTHDMTSFLGWWAAEADTVDENLFKRICTQKGIPFEAVCEKLFDRGASGFGRLRWRPEVSEEGRFLEILGRSRDEAWELVDMYLGTYNEKKRYLDFLKQGRPGNLDSDTARITAALEKVTAAASIFSIQLLQDWLSMREDWKEDACVYRINVPGTMNDQNWTLAVPFSLEEMQRQAVNKKIKAMNQNAGRI